MALLFAGNNTDEVSFPDIPDNMTVGTLAVWVRLDDTSFTRISWKGPQANNFVTLFHEATVGFQFTYQRSTTPLRVNTGPDTATPEEWQFVVVTWDTAGTDSDQRIYLGSVSSDAIETVGVQAVGAGTHDDSGSGFELGARASSNQRFLGDIAWVGMWSRQLTPSEIVSQQWRPALSSGVVLWSELGLQANGPVQNFAPGATLVGATGCALADAHAPYRRFAPTSIRQFVTSAGGGSSVGATLEDTFVFSDTLTTDSTIELSFDESVNDGGSFDDSALITTIEDGSPGGGITTFNPSESFTFADTLATRNQITRTLVG